MISIQYRESDFRRNENNKFIFIIENILLSNAIANTKGKECERNKKIIDK